MGGKSSSSSDSSNWQSSTSTTTNNNIDRRQVVAEGAFGLAADGATVSITNNSLDGEVIGKALDVVAQSDATNGDGFNSLLRLADKFISGAGDVIGKTQETTMKQIEAVNMAANDKSGQIDQKTMMVAVGAAAAVAIAFAVGKK